MSIYAYTRVSTSTQAEKGFGLDEQKFEIEQYALTNGLIIDDWFEDAGVSGALADADEDEAIEKRTGLMACISNINQDDVLLVLNTSRLWRSDMAKVIIKRLLIKRGARIISVQQNQFDLYATNPNDRFFVAIMEAMDVWERSTIAIKLAGGRTAKANHGDKPAGITPYGYAYSTDKKSIVINEQEAKIVRTIFSEAQKGMSLSKIMNMLNNQGLITRQGKEWGRSSLSAILHNDFYTGVLVHQGKAIQGNHTPLISKIQFGKVQAQLKRKQKS